MCDLCAVCGEERIERKEFLHSVGRKFVSKKPTQRRKAAHDHGNARESSLFLVDDTRNRHETRGEDAVDIASSVENSRQNNKRRQKEVVQPDRLVRPVNGNVDDAENTKKKDGHQVGNDSCCLFSVCELILAVWLTAEDGLLASSDLEKNNQSGNDEKGQCVATQTENHGVFSDAVKDVVIFI